MGFIITHSWNTGKCGRAHRINQLARDICPLSGVYSSFRVREHGCFRDMNYIRRNDVVCVYASVSYRHTFFFGQVLLARLIELRIYIKKKKCKI